MSLMQSSGGSTLQVVSFRLEAALYGIDILRIQEVLHPLDVTAIPNAPHFVDGVIQLRGHIIPIVDLRRRLGVHAARGSTERIIVVDLRDRLLGLRVDEVHKVVRVHDGDYDALPDAVISDASSNCIAALVRAHDKLLMLIDPDRVLNASQALQVFEAHIADETPVFAEEEPP